MTNEEQMIEAAILRGGSLADQLAQFRSQANQAARAAVAPVDTSGLVDFARQREGLGHERQLLGAMAQSGPSRMAGLAAPMWKSGLELAEPMKVGEEGYLTGKSFTRNPFEQQRVLTRALSGLGDATRQGLTTEMTAKEKQAQMALHAQKIRESQHAMDVGKWMAVDTPGGGKVLANPFTGEVFNPAGAGGGAMGGPDTLPKTATNEERKKYAADTALVQTMPSMMKAVEANPDAFGFKRGVAEMAGGALRTGPLNKALLLKQLTPEQASARAQLFTHYASLINEMIGTAQTDTERANLRPFIPQTGESAEEILMKMRGAMEIAQRSREAARGRYGLAPAPAPAPASSRPAPAQAPAGAGWKIEKVQ